MPKTYLIPHNFTNNGRVFNMFHKRDLIKALLWFIPVTALLFHLPVRLNTKLFCEIIFVFPPVIAILAGYANWIYHIVRFMQNRRVYYHVKEDNGHVFAYQRLKKEKADTRAGHNG